MTRGLLTLTLALGLFAGCGGGDDDGGGGGGDALSKDAFVAEANKICLEGEQKITDYTNDAEARIQEAASLEDQQKVFAEVLEEAAQQYDPFLERLRDLNPPEELSDDWDGFIDSVAGAIDLIPEVAAATRDGDRDKLNELTDRFTDIADDTRPFAQTHKLDECLPDGAGSE